MKTEAVEVTGHQIAALKRAVGVSESVMADIIGRDVKTLRRWRQAGKGLPHFKLNGSVFYPVERNLELLRSLVIEGVTHARIETR